MKRQKQSVIEKETKKRAIISSTINKRLIDTSQENYILWKNNAVAYTCHLYAQRERETRT